MILRVEVDVESLMTVNTYFFVDDETRHGFLIDPGSQAERLLKIISEKNFVIEKILLTHGHFDHIGAVNQLQAELKIPALMQENGKNYASNPAMNLSRYTVEREEKLNDVNFISDGTIISLEKNPSFSLKMIHTPGHTTDGAIYYSEKNSLAFVGDTIFKMSYGRTDFPGGNFSELMNSIRTKVLTLPDETILLSGHGEETTVADEKIFFA